MNRFLHHFTSFMTGFLGVRQIKNLGYDRLNQFPLTICATVSHSMAIFFLLLRIVLTSSSAALNRDPSNRSVRTSIASAIEGNRGCLFLNDEPSARRMGLVANMWHVKNVVKNIFFSMLSGCTAFGCMKGSCPGRQLIPSTYSSTPMASHPQAYS